MKNHTAILTYTKYFTLFIVLPVVVFTQFFSWLKVNHNLLYVTYSESWFPGLDIYQDVILLPIQGKILVGLLEAVSTLLILWALWTFLGVVRLYQQGEHFSYQALTKCKKITNILLCWAIYKLFFNTLATIIISIFKSAGKRYIIMSVSQYDVFNFFGVLLLFIVVYALHDARKLKSEHDLTV